MRFLIVNKFLYPNGGSETYIFGLGRQLRAMGHEVQYFGMEHPDRCVGNAVDAYTSNMDFHAAASDADHGKSGGASVLGKLKKLTLPIRIIYSREARLKIRRVLDDFKPDVVHLNNINFQITPSVIYEIRKWDREKNADTKHSIHDDTADGVCESGSADAVRPCKIIFTAHDYQWICPNHMLYIPGHDGSGGRICDRCKGGRFIECTKHNCIHNSKARSLIGSIEGYYYKWRKTYSMVDTIICPSQFLYDKFADNPQLKDKLVVMHNFIEVDEKPTSKTALNVDKTSDKVNAEQSNNSKEAPLSLHNIPNNYALYFGRFAKEKGVRTLLEATKRLPNIPFVFAGSGPLEDDVRLFSDTHDNVSFVGFKTGDELKELISGAAFSIYPSEWYENCPFSVMESISLGTPVLGSDIGGIPELIIHNNTEKTSVPAIEPATTAHSEENMRMCGLLFTPGDIEDLSDKIQAMWSDRELLSKLTDNCRKNDFDSLEEYTKKFLEVIE